MGWESGEKREFKFDPNSTENEGRWRLYDPKKIDKGSYFRRKSSTPGVSYVVGKAGGKSVVQAVRFDKDKFTEAAAAKWWAKNHGRGELVFSDEGGKKAMDTRKIAAELVAVAKELVAGGMRSPSMVRGPWMKDRPCGVCGEMYCTECGKNPKGLYLGDVVSKRGKPWVGKIWAASRGYGVVSVRWETPGGEVSTEERPVDLKLISKGV